jgi:GntR family transcriptional repressor for pyruvate dehydrogenase complex
MRSYELKKENLADQISDLLRERIIAGEWKVGEKISSENELASYYGVSRLTIRLALQKLLALGMLETRVGEGTFVKEFDFDWYINEIADILIKPEMLDDVQEFRRLIEIESAKLAMKTATEEQIQELIDISILYESYRFDSSKSLDYNVEKQASLDYEFHYKICEISNNSLLKLAYSIAKKPIEEYLKIIIKSRWENYIKSTNSDIFESFTFPSSAHYKMAQAIKDKNIEKFKKLYYKMVNYKDTKDYYISIDD